MSRARVRKHHTLEGHTKMLIRPEIKPKTSVGKYANKPELILEISPNVFFRGYVSAGAAIHFIHT